MSRHPHARAVTRYIAHITDRAGIPHRIALVAFCLSDARREALLVGPVALRAQLQLLPRQRHPAGTRGMG